MNHAKKIDFNERLTTAAEAKKALLEKFKPKPMITAVEPIDRAARLEAQREAIRQQRASEKEAALVAKAEAVEAARKAAFLPSRPLWKSSGPSARIARACRRWTRSNAAPNVSPPTPKPRPGT